MSELRDAIIAESQRIGMDPEDFATFVSFETGGTFDPWQKGPTTKWGRHVGLIQMGEPQRRQYGYTPDKSTAQLVASSADYLVDRGFKPGMGILDAYSIINAGSPGKYNAVDGNTTVRQKVAEMNGGHRGNARKFLGGEYATRTSAPTETFSDSVDFGQSFSKDTASYVAPNPDVPMVEDDKLPPPSTFGQQFGAAADQNWSDFANQYIRGKDPMDVALGPDNMELNYDPNFKLTQEHLQAVPEQYYDWFDEARSQGHYDRIKSFVDKDIANTQLLSDAGWGGTAASVLASIASPEEWLIEGATLGLATPIVAGAKIGRAGKVAINAGVGMTSGALQGAYQVATNKHMDSSTIALNAALGGAFGAALGGIAFKADAAPEMTTLHNVAASLKSNPSFASTLDPSGNLSAAQRGALPPELLNDREIADLLPGDLDKTGIQVGRYDSVGQLKSSPNPLANGIGGLAEDGVGNAGHTVNRIGVSEEKEFFHRQFETSYAKSYNPAFGKYVADKGISRFNKGAAHEQFGEEITAFIRDTRTDSANYYHPSVVQVGNKMRGLLGDIGELASMPGAREGIIMRSVRGFEDFARNNRYVPRIFSGRKINEVVLQHGSDKIEELITAAIRKAQPDIEEEILGKLAKGYFKAIYRRANFGDSATMRALGGEDLDELERLLRMDGGMAAPEAKHIVDELKKKQQRKSDAGNVDRAKHRVLLDENMQIGDLKFSDLLINDANVLFRGYSRSMTGHIALARFRLKAPTGSKMIVDGFTNENEFENYLKTMREWGAENIPPGANKQKIMDRDEANARFLYDQITGRAHPQSGTKMATYLRLLRKYNFARVMNQVGFAQAMETSVAISSLGWKAVMSSMPAFRRTINMDGESILKSGYDAELEGIFGAGTERLRGSIPGQYDEWADEGPLNDRKGALAKAERLLDGAGRITSDISGMSFVTTAQQRMVNKAIVQRFANMAFKGDTMSAKRLAQIGLSKDMSERVLKMFKENVKTRNGTLFKNKVAKLNIDDWTDQEARAAFEMSAFRLSRRLVQENDIGGMHRWMSSPLAKTIVQFRTFMLHAFTKSTLHHIHMRDKESFAMLVYSTVFGGAIYAAQEQLKSVGRSDREEYLAKKLSIENLAKASFARSAYASLLPAATDTVGGYLFGMDPMFDFRSSGQRSDLIFGNPTTGLLFDDIPAASGAIFDPIMQGREMSQQEGRAIARPLIWQNFLPFTATLNMMIADQPKYAPKDY